MSLRPNSRSIESKNWQNLWDKQIKSVPLQPHVANKADRYAEIAQLVEHNLAKVGVAGSSPVFRSRSRNGGIGRHEGLKIPWPVMAVRVRVPLAAPKQRTSESIALRGSFFLFFLVDGGPVAHSPHCCRSLLASTCSSIRSSRKGKKSKPVMRSTSFTVFI